MTPTFVRSAREAEEREPPGIRKCPAEYDPRIVPYFLHIRARKAGA